ncbi:MAG: hypothetical protein L6R45_09725 [Anaerolineae bacterium]|nr:hypothetical protein [Anaerolineae bacterium]
MLPGTAPSTPSGQKEKDKDERRKIIIALLFLLLSFSCIFCSSQSALWLINRDRVDASMRSRLSADYGFDPAQALAPLSEDIIAEAEHDEAALLARQTPIAVGLGIAILPNPIPTPEPTAITLLPTPTPTPTPAVPSNPAPAPATPALPTTTQEAPPTSLPATSTSAPPTLLPPTVPATVPPTVPATVPPTVPPTAPATVPPTNPATVPPTSPPTTAPPTATATPTNTATATDTPTATATATDTPTSTPIPIVAFNAATFNINENGGSAVITVLLSASSGQTVTVNYTSLAGGTATLGSDYTPISGTLTFSPGQTNQTFNVSITDDATANEGNETVLLELSTPVNATLGLSNATLTIIEDDPTPSVQFGSNNYSVMEDVTTVPIDVTLSAASALTVTVDYATGNQTAEEGSDYTAASGILTFPPGSTSQTFSINIADDNLDEPAELIGLTLANPVNAMLGAVNTATLTIIDNDTGTGLCAGLYPPGEPNVGSPNGVFARVACDAGMIIDLGSNPINRSDDANFDLVYYEVQGTNPIPNPNPLQIYMDWIVVEVGQTPSGPWFQVFYWGDPTLDANTNIGQAGYGPPENDNLLIPMAILYGAAPLNTGIAIDVDAPLTAAGAPSGSYQYVRIFSPIDSGSDGPEIDAIEAIP